MGSVGCSVGRVRAGVGSVASNAGRRLGEIDRSALGNGDRTKRKSTKPNGKDDQVT